MNFHKVWRITQILLISQLRATATRRNVSSFIRRPVALVMLDAVLFIAVSGIAYYGGLYLRQSAELASMTRQYLTGTLITLPAIILGVILVLGLVLEVGGGSQSSSSETINWMPITAGEYVLASVLMMLAYYSVFPTLLLAATMSLAYLFGLFSVWTLALVLSILGILVSASALEILRAALSRFSGSFYKRGGRGAIVARAVFGIIIIVVFELLFNPTFYTRIIGAITANFGPSWFIPVLWSSVSVAALLAGEIMLSAEFALVFIVLTAALFYGATIARTRYWVTTPAAVRVSTASYAPTRSSLTRLLNPSELAIMRKDLRGLIRRREMVRYLALPGVFLVTFLLGSASGGFGGFEYFGFLIIAISTMFISLANMGSEGRSIANLYQFPLALKDFVRGKAGMPILFNVMFGTALFLVMGILSGQNPLFIALLLIIDGCLVFEIAFFGMMLGIKFPFFAETSRSSFMSQSAGLIGMPSAIAIMLLSLSPAFYELVIGAPFSGALTGFGVSLFMILILAIVFYRATLELAKTFLSQLPGMD